MDVMALINGVVALTVIGGAVWAIVALFVLGLCRSAAVGDQAMEAYIAEQLGRSNEWTIETHGNYDQAAVDWIAAQRRAS